MDQGASTHEAIEEVRIHFMLGRERGVPDDRALFIVKALEDEAEQAWIVTRVGHVGTVSPPSVKRPGMTHFGNIELLRDGSILNPRAHESRSDRGRSGS